MIPSMIWSLFLLSLTRVAIHEGESFRIGGAVKPLPIPKMILSDPYIAATVKEFNLEEVLPQLASGAKTFLRGSDVGSEVTFPDSQATCATFLKEHAPDVDERKLMLRAVGSALAFTGRMAGRGIGALFYCLVGGPNPAAAYSAHQVIQTPSTIQRLPPSLVTPRWSSSFPSEYQQLMRPPSPRPPADDEDDDDWYSVDTPSGSEDDDADEEGDLPYLTREQFTALTAKIRQQERGIELVSPADLTRIPSTNVYVSTLLSKLSYHTVEDMMESASPEILGLLAKQAPGFPVFIDSQDQFDTQVYIWLSAASRTLYISFRGTNSWADVKHDLDYRSVAFDEEHPEVMVHAGFRNKFKSVESDILEITRGHTSLYDKVVITGHSLGGAIATMASPAVAEEHPEKIIECLTFGSPRVGNEAFVNWFTATVDLNFRITMDKDPVQWLPFESQYSHVSHAISFNHLGQVSKVPDPPAEKRFWYALQDLDLDWFIQDHKLDTYIVRLNSIIKKNN